MIISSTTVVSKETNMNMSANLNTKYLFSFVKWYPCHLCKYFIRKCLLYFLNITEHPRPSRIKWNTSIFLLSKCTSMLQRTDNIFTVPCTQNNYYSILINSKDFSKALSVRGTYLSAGVRLSSTSGYHEWRFPVFLALSLLGFVVPPKARPALSKKYKTPLQFSLSMVTLVDSLRVNGVKN